MVLKQIIDAFCGGSLSGGEQCSLTLEVNHVLPSSTLVSWLVDFSSPAVRIFLLSV